MLKFTHKAGNTLHYEVSERLSTEDLRAYYDTIATHYRRFGKLKLLVRVHDFKGYRGLRTLFVFMRHEPGLLWKVERYAAVANQAWFRQIIDGIDALMPTVKLRAFKLHQAEEAQEWLYDQAARTQDAERR